MLGKELETTWTLVKVEPDSMLTFEGDAVNAFYLHSKQEKQAEEILAKLKTISESSI